MKKSSGFRILVVDDVEAVATMLRTILQKEGHEVIIAGDGQAALPIIERGGVDLVLSDLKMPVVDGMELLRQISDRWPDVPFIMLTAFGTVENAVKAMKLGAAEFLTKPFHNDVVTSVVDRVLRADVGRERPPEPPRSRSKHLVGNSTSMGEVFDLIDRASRGDTKVLLTGETGSGKSVVARAIHEQSGRSKAPFIEVHCAAFPEGLIESELFGYEKGAFSEAAKDKPGRVELAKGGTLFLDEIGDVPLAMQVKLLRLLENKAFERLGGTKTLTADVRIIAATHRDLRLMINQGKFREDLFYRLYGLDIWVPPLRDRREDIAELAGYFCDKIGRESDRKVRLSDEAAAMLTAEPWPGNVRQLQNFVEKLVVMSDSDVIGVDDVQREIERSARRSGGNASVSTSNGSADATQTLEEVRSRAEKDHIILVLRRCGGNRSQAARILGISRRTLYNKLEEHGLEELEVSR